MYLREVELRRGLVPDATRYPFSIPALRSMEQVTLRGSVTFLVGENGSGKSTLLEGIAHQCGFAIAGGGRNNRFEVESSESALGPYLRLRWLPKMTQGFYLRAETFYHFATYLDRLEEESPGALAPYGGRSLHAQSHGESFLALFTNRFGRQAIYLLDEPEAALSPILLGYPGAQILTFDTDPVSEISYEETDHYQVTRGFLERRASVLAELFRES